MNIPMDGLIPIWGWPKFIHKRNAWPRLLLFELGQVEPAKETSLITTVQKYLLLIGKVKARSDASLIRLFVCCGKNKEINLDSWHKLTKMKFYKTILFILTLLLLRNFILQLFYFFHHKKRSWKHLNAYELTRKFTFSGWFFPWKCSLFLR